jgi:hypothetical protein
VIQKVAGHNIHLPRFLDDHYEVKPVTIIERPNLVSRAYPFSMHRHQLLAEG